MHEPFKLWTWLALEKKKIDQRPGPPGSIEGEKLFREHRKIADQLYRQGKIEEAKARLELALRYYRDEITT